MIVWKESGFKNRLGWVGMNVVPGARVRMGRDLPEDWEEGPPLAPGGVLPLPEEWAAPVSSLPLYADGQALPGPSDYHLTLKYGLLPGLVTKQDVYSVLEGLADQRKVLPRKATVTDVLCFGPDHNCICLGLGDLPWEERLEEGDDGWQHVQATFADLNAALSQLPHVDSWSGYTPHVSLGYVHPDVVDQVVTMLEAVAVGTVVTFELPEVEDETGDLARPSPVVVVNGLDA